MAALDHASHDFNLSEGNNMDRIIAGRFQTKATADSAVTTMGGYLAQKDVCIFHNNPPGQHDVAPMGGDESVDPGSRDGAESSLGTALAGGLAAGAIGMLGGPVVALAAAGVGAYTGSMVGAIGGLGDDDPPPHAMRRPAGVIVAVRLAFAGDEQRVIADLRRGGAVDIEHANGIWDDGDWSDFNPAAAPQLVASA